MMSFAKQDPLSTAFRAARRKEVNVSLQGLVRTGYLREGGTLPLVIQPAMNDVDLGDWAENNRELIQTDLRRHGAILFRDFSIATSDHFHLLVRKIAVEPMAYQERSSPRTKVGDNIYTSTDYPATESIFPHNEHSYSNRFPLKLFFWCEIAARQGGETPLGDTRKIYKRIPYAIRKKFAEKGWMFVRNFNSGFGLPWQTVFQTEEKAAVEEYCRKAGIEWEWRGEGKLRTRQVRPAIARHPHTQELVWFNHATFFHVSTLQPSVASALRANYAEDELPNNTFYGDGSPILEEEVAILRQAYLDEMVSSPWQAGDVILIDNMLVAHARAPYAGPRRILFAMAEPTDGQPLPPGDVNGE
jgi:alpha-ketoglutarate-dependent taurine dioxygenase